MKNLTINDLQVIENEPRIKDVVLGVVLGLHRAVAIKQVIEANIQELQGFGPCPLQMETEKVGCVTRQVKTYYLNEPQALLLCMFSRTARAAQVRKELIEVYMAYRTRGLAKVREHYRRNPQQSVPRETVSRPSAISCSLPVADRRDNLPASPAYHPSGASFLEWYISAVHALGALRSEYEYLKQHGMF